MTVTDAQDGTELDLRDERILAGVIMAGPGAGTGFSKMRSKRSSSPASRTTTPCSPTARTGSDAYHRSPGDNKMLLTLFGAEHVLGNLGL